jgi:hypothetical protein
MPEESRKDFKNQGFKFTSCTISKGILISIQARFEII